MRHGLRLVPRWSPPGWSTGELTVPGIWQLSRPTAPALARPSPPLGVRSRRAAESGQLGARQPTDRLPWVTSPDTEPDPTGAVPYEPHVGTTRQYWRDIILGVNDGLVSMLLLVAGVVGGGLATRQILLTAVAGAVAGAISMALGEYLATKSQDEVLDSELELEATHIRHFRGVEVAQLREMFSEMGVTGDDLTTAVGIFSRTDERLLGAMKALEFGVVDTERRSPYRAAAMSGTLFLAGSLPSVVPFTFAVSPGIGLTWASAMTAVGLFIVGAAKTRVTRTNPVLSGLENLIVAGAGGVLAFWIGRLFDNQLS